MTASGRHTDRLALFTFCATWAYAIATSGELDETQCSTDLAVSGRQDTLYRHPRFRHRTALRPHSKPETRLITSVTTIKTAGRFYMAESEREVIFALFLVEFWKVLG